MTNLMDKGDNLHFLGSEHCQTRNVKNNQTKIKVRGRIKKYNAFHI